MKNASQIEFPWRAASRAMTTPLRWWRAMGRPARFPLVQSLLLLAAATLAGAAVYCAEDLARIPATSGTMLLSFASGSFAALVIGPSRLPGKGCALRQRACLAAAMPLRATNPIPARAEGSGAARTVATTARASPESPRLRAGNRRSLEPDLRQALTRGEFELHYQPLISVRRRQVCGFEALLRWRHPVHGLVPPGDFIPLAEETGLIGAIDQWVLHTACAEATKWPAELNVAVNLSPLQFASRDLVDGVQAALTAAGLRAERLELEITEGALLHDNALTLDILQRLRGKGARISMDDFGAGYSSLHYLRSFPFDKIKIDKSFVHGLDDGEQNGAIVRAIAGLGRSLGIATTAEGVETRAQLDRVVAEGCTELQGFFFSPPLPARKVPSLLRQGLSRAA